MRSLLPIVVLFLTLATSAYASDGVNEINQTCAVLTGCFVGDSAGFPVTIGSGPTRSYRLTGDLVVPDGDTTAIFVVASGVTLDLGGFEIRGSNLCTKPPAGGPLFCTFSGSGAGVAVTGERVAISNGSIVGMGAHGIDVPTPPSSGSSGYVIHDLRVAYNGSSGIHFQAGSAVTISDVTAVSNGIDGVHVENGRAVTARNVKAVSNGGEGIHLIATGCLVIDSTADLNGLHGIRADLGGTVTGSTVNFNEDSGIFMADASGSINAAFGMVSNSSAYGNRRNGIEAFGTISGNLVQSNFGDGIVAGPGTMIQGNMVLRNRVFGVTINNGGTIQGNTVRDNGSGLVLGIQPADPTIYRENTISGNILAAVTGIGLNGGNNFCNGTPTCP